MKKIVVEIIMASVLASVAIATCSDSDGGFNPFVQGFSQGNIYDGSYWEASDTCTLYNADVFPYYQTDVPSCFGADCIVTEWFCSAPDNFLAMNYNFHCDLGCVNGACISPEPPVCVPNDCAINTCSEQTCNNGCEVVQGTKDCSPPVCYDKHGRVKKCRGGLFL